MSHIMALVMAVGFSLVGMGTVQAQAYPERPIRIITSSPGGGADLMARVIAQGLSQKFEQPVVVDNRGGSLVLQAQLLSRAAPDGYTLLIAGNTFWILPLVEKVFYEAMRDFTPITVTTSSPTVLVIHPSIPAKNVKELIAYAKSRPKQLNYASGNLGSTTHLAFELFNSMAGIEVVRVPYKGSGPAMVALISGEVQMAFGPASSVTPHVKSGKVRALATGNPVATDLAPGLPPIATEGLPGYESGTYHAVFGPSGLPQALVRQINQEIARYVTQDTIRQKLRGAGLDVVASSPEKTADILNGEVNRIDKVLRAAGVRVQ